MASSFSYSSTVENEANSPCDFVTRFGLENPLGRVMRPEEVRCYRHARQELRNTLARAIAWSGEVPRNHPDYMTMNDINKRLRAIFLKIPSYEEVTEAGFTEFLFGKDRTAKVDETLDNVNKLSKFATTCLQAFNGKTTEDLNDMTEEERDATFPPTPESFAEEHFPNILVNGPKTFMHTMNSLSVKLAISAKLFISCPTWLDKFLCIVMMYIDITGFKIALTDLLNALRVLFKKAWAHHSFDPMRYPDIDYNKYPRPQHQWADPPPTPEPAETQDPNQEVPYEEATETGATEVISAIVMIGGFITYGKMPDKSSTAKVIGSLATKLQNIGKMSNGVHGGIKLYQTLVLGVNEAMDKFVDLICPEKSSLRILDENKERISTWMDRVNQLDREDTYIRLTCDPALHTEIGRLRDQADEYSAIYQKLDYRPLNISALFMKAVNAIIRISNKATHISLNIGCRPDPFCVYLYGEPGVGKSFISTELIHEVADKFNVPKFRRMYPRSMDEKFWSDYSQQFAVVIDDFGQLRDPTQFDPYAEFIAIKSPVPKTVQMAEVSEKGRQFTSQMISISSNIAYPNPNSIQDRKALWRRRDALVEVVKQSQVLLTKIKIGSTDHLKFRFLSPVEEGKALSEFMDYTTLKQRIIDMATEHLERQKEVAAYLNRRDFTPTKECGDSEDDEELFDEFESTRELLLKVLNGTERGFSSGERFVRVSATSHPWYSTRGKYSHTHTDWALYKDFMADLSTSLARQYSALNSPTNPTAHDYTPMYVGFDDFGLLNLPPWWLTSRNHWKVPIAQPPTTESGFEFVKRRSDKIFRHCNPFTDRSTDDIITYISNIFKYDMCDGFYFRGTPVQFAVDECGLDDPIVTDIDINIPEFHLAKPTPRRCNPEHQEPVVPITIYDMPSTSTAPPPAAIYQPDPPTMEELREKFNKSRREFEGNIGHILTCDRCDEFTCISECAMEFTELVKLNTSWAEYLDMLIQSKRTMGGSPICIRCSGILFEERRSATIITYESLLTKLKSNVADFMKKHPTIVKVIAITGAVASAFAVYKLWATFSDEEEFDQEEVEQERIYKIPNYGQKHKVQEHGKEYYRGETKRAARKPAARVLVTERGCDPNAEQIMDNRIMPSMVRFERVVELDGDLHRVYHQNAFQIVGKLFLVNAHALMKFEEGDFVRIRARSGVEYVIAFRPEDCAYSKEGDIAIYNAGPSVPSAKDSTGLVCLEKDLSYLNNFSSNTVQLDTELRNYYYYADLKAHDVTKSVPYLDKSKIILRKAWTARVSVEKGECGGISVALVPQCPRKIVGIVSATFNNRPQGLFQIVTQELLQPLLDKFPQQIVDEGLNAKSELLKITKVEVRESGLELGNIEVLENYKIKNATNARGTRIRKSPLFDLFPHQTEPAVLHAKDPRMETPLDPLITGVRKYGSYHKPLPPRQLQMAYDSLEQEMLMFEPLRPKVGALSVEDAINGLPIMHYDRIDMKSSPGVPYIYSRPPNESGKAYLFDIDEDGHAEIKSKLLANEIEARLKYYKVGKRYPSVWTNCLKDERRSLEKIRTGNTRTFMMAPVDFTIVCRMYFLDLCASIINNRIHSFHAVGINADSSEWTLLFMTLQRISEYGFDGDYKNWDGFLFAIVMNYFGDVANAWYNDGPEAALVRRAILDETIHTYSVVKGFIIRKNHGAPSGVPFTAIINSFGNSLIIRTGYLCIALDAKRLGQTTQAYCNMNAYRTNVKEITFGDDNINAITMPVLEFFNQHTYAEWLSRFGIQYTDADKTLKDPPPYKKILECHFLKRGFVRDDRFPSRIRAPIEMKTIQELINWVTDTLDPEEQLELNYIDALRFLFHYGKEVFNNFRKVVDSGMKELGMLPPAITYEYFQEEFDDTFI